MKVAVLAKPSVATPFRDGDLEFERSYGAGMKNKSGMRCREFTSIREMTPLFPFFYDNPASFASPLVTPRHHISKSNLYANLFVFRKN